MVIGTEESHPLEPVDKIACAENKANSLIDLLKEKKYKTVLTSAQDTNTLTSLGIRRGLGEWSLRIDKPLSEDSIRAGLRLIGTYSKVDFGREYEPPQTPIVNFADYELTNPQITIPNVFLQGMAEIYAEEWLHIMQELRIAAGQDPYLSGISQDQEIDVAVYLVQKGYKPTKFFLERNGRNEKLRELKLIE